MRTAPIKWFVAGIALCTFGAVLVRGTAVAQDDEAALKKRVIGLNRVTGDDPIQAEIKILFGDAAGTKKLLAYAAKLAKGEKPPFNYTGAYILASVAHRMRDLEHGQLFYRICTKEATKLLSSQKLADAYGGYIELLFAHQKFDEGAKICQEFLDLPEPDMDPRGPVTRLKPVVLIQMILGIARQGKTEEATKMIDKFLKDQPKNFILLEVKAQVEREAGRYEESAKLYEEVLDRLAKDKEATKEEKDYYLERFRYRLSNLYIDLKKVDKASEQLKKLLEAKPDDPTYNNDLGYIWADHDMNLDEAEKLIRKAIDEDRKQRKKLELTADEDRDNAAYLDSLGWVLYKKKNFKEARDWLIKATKERDGQHVEILDHLGDAHLALEEKAEAIAAWEQALKVPALGKRDEQRKAEVKKKLEMHKK